MKDRKDGREVINTYIEPETRKLLDLLAVLMPRERREGHRAGRTTQGEVIDRAIRELAARTPAVRAILENEEAQPNA